MQLIAMVPGWYRRSRSIDTESRAGRKDVDDEDGAEVAGPGGSEIALANTGKRVASSPVRGRRLPTITFDEDVMHPSKGRSQASEGMAAAIPGSSREPSIGAAIERALEGDDIEEGEYGLIGSSWLS